MSPFSVCMSVYRNDRPNDVFLSIRSVLEQTVIPNEVVVVIDGPISDELMAVLCDFESNGQIRMIRLAVNGGLGNALHIGVIEAKNELIARMDSDDIASKDRFEKQLKCFELDERLSIVGGAITEFIDEPENVIAKRICPTTDNEIKTYMKSRCGLNHVTVMFKKSEVIKSGNYQHWHYNEDYFLWLRMMLAGCRFSNLSDTLVNVRVGKDMYMRRGGREYFLSEKGLQKFMWQNKIISLPHYLYNVFVRFTIQVIMPNTMRGWVFRTFARSK